MPEAPDRIAGSPDAMRDILTVLRIRTGHDFSNYKPGTVQRRVARRVHLRHLPDIQAYARFLRENPHEAVTLMKELLISVTNFFRDPPAFEALNDAACCRASSRTRAATTRCGSGCRLRDRRRGLFDRHAARRTCRALRSEPPALQVFATDLDEQAIAAAREAFYTNSEVADVSEERLQRFFVREAGGYRVRRELREVVLFAPHNVIRDPPFSHLDLISCRNLLIYLNGRCRSG